MKLYNVMVGIDSTIAIYEKVTTADWSKYSETEKQIALKYINIPINTIELLKDVRNAYHQNIKKWSKITIK